MKKHKVWIPIALVCVIAAFALWQLNDIYKSDKNSAVLQQMEQQSNNISSAVTSYLTQLKNILSSYENGAIESQINWIQLTPFFALARAEINAEKKYVVKDFFAHSEQAGKAWTAAFLNQALSFFKDPGQPLSVKLFKNKTNLKFIALAFVDENKKKCTIVVAEADIFQKFLLQNKSQVLQHSLLTSDQIVAAHSQSSYIATISNEGRKIDPKFLFEKKTLRGTDLELISFAKKADSDLFFVIPFHIVGLTVGVSLILIALLIYSYGPVEKAAQSEMIRRREQSYSDTLETSKKQLSQNLISNKQSLQKSPEGNQEAQFDNKNREPIAKKETVGTINQIALKQETSIGVTDVIKKSFGSFGFYEVSELIKEALSHVKPAMKEFRVQCFEKIESTASVEVDPDRFIKAITNILTNSVEAVKDRQVREIHVGFFENKNGICLRISDSGSGVKEDHLQKIWQPFFTTKDKKLHKGLGLSEAISIARRYGMDLKISNQTSGGLMTELTFVQSEQKKNHVVENVLPTAREAASTSNTGSNPYLGNESETQGNYNLEMTDSEIENILNLDDIEVQLTPQQIKIDQKIEIQEEPQIHLEKRTKSMDLANQNSPILIRRPQIEKSKKP